MTRPDLFALALEHAGLTSEAEAELIRDKAVFSAHWAKDLERWFKDSVDSPGLVLIKAHAKRPHD